MADLDTRSKRASSVGILVGFFVLALPLPDGAIAQADRQHIAWSYSGIAASAPAVAVPDALVVLLRHEILSVPVVAPETLSVPLVAPETLSVPSVPGEVLSC